MLRKEWQGMPLWGWLFLATLLTGWYAGWVLPRDKAREAYLNREVQAAVAAKPDDPNAGGEKLRELLAPPSTQYK